LSFFDSCRLKRVTEWPPWVREAAAHDMPQQVDAVLTRLERKLGEAGVTVGDLVYNESADWVGILAGRTVPIAKHDGLVLATLFEVLKQEKIALKKLKAEKERAAKAVAANPNMETQTKKPPR
jgi:hypothetical protein